jgi:TolB protein
VDVDTGDLKQITTTAADERSPCWSPDKGQIAYSNNLGELWVVNRDGTGARKLETGQEQCDQPDWHPDGGSLLFVAYLVRQGERSKVYSMRVAGEKAGSVDLLVDRDSLVQYPAWLPDGQAIIYSQFKRGSLEEPIEELWVREIANGQDTQITRTGVQNVNADYSPDGRKILFVSTLRDNHDVWCLAADAQRLVRLTTHHGFDGEPCWSPAGDRIAFVSTVDGHRNVWVMKADGSEKQQLTQGSGDCRDPDW